MISPLLIVIAAVLAAAAVFLTAWYSHWPVPHLVAASAATLVAVIAWRLLSNVLSLNEDFMPAISIGDAVCLIAGGLPPAVVAAVDPKLPRKWLPAVAGALIAFTVNVVIL